MGIAGLIAIQAVQNATRRRDEEDQRGRDEEEEDELRDAKAMHVRLTYQHWWSPGLEHWGWRPAECTDGATGIVIDNAPAGATGAVGETGITYGAPEKP